MERLQQITDKNYPGMFLPSTLIIMMNEVKAERYTIHVHKLRLDLTGRYNTITIRSDIKEWLKSNYEENKEEYLELYNVKCFTRFVSYFIVNMIESKNDLERRFNCTISNFCYPYGDLNLEIVNMVKDAGYQTATTVQRGRSTILDNKLELPRIPIWHSTLPHLFLLKILTRYEDKR